LRGADPIRLALLLVAIRLFPAIPAIAALLSIGYCLHHDDWPYFSDRDFFSNWRVQREISYRSTPGLLGEHTKSAAQMVSETAAPWNAISKVPSQFHLVGVNRRGAKK
jgi:hypothetical protein